MSTSLSSLVYKLSEIYKKKNKKKKKKKKCKRCEEKRKIKSACDLIGLKNNKIK